MTIHHTINGVPFQPETESSQLRAELELEASESARFWAKLSEDTRDVYRRVARTSLELLHSSIDYWLPHAMVEQSAGDKVEIKSQILFLDVHQQVSAMDQATAFEEARMLDRIRQKVAQGREERTDEEFLAYVDECIAHGTRLSTVEVKRLRDFAS